AAERPGLGDRRRHRHRPRCTPPPADVRGADAVAQPEPPARRRRRPELPPLTRNQVAPQPGCTGVRLRQSRKQVSYAPGMDTYLTIASRRETREFADAPLPDDVADRILDAGRLSGSSQNTQLWEFVVVSDREALAECVYAPGNILGAALAVAIAG